MSASLADLPDASLRDRVAALEWYHTLELGPGVVTPGWFDLRAMVNEIPWPDVAGKRCLDVGTFDGFWAFELERRGADKVIAIDVLDPLQWDWPVGCAPDALEAIAKRKAQGVGFELARDALRSKVERIELSIYDLDPESIGTFDVVYLGSLLLHLRDPILGLDRVRRVCRGDLVVVDAIDLPLTLALPRRPTAALDGRGRPWWWKPNVAGLVRMVESAGFQVVEGPRRLFMKPGAGQQLPRFRPRMLATRAGRELATSILRGDPHAALRARPR